MNGHVDLTECVRSVVFATLWLTWTSVQDAESLTCFDCKFSFGLSTCSTRTVCRADQLCSLTKYQFSAGPYFSMGCTDSNKCQGQSNFPNTLIGRRDAKREQEICTTCCHSDGCNNVDCQTKTTVDGHWSAWSQWSPCSATCGPGHSIRSRTCSNPFPSSGGKPCANPASFKEVRFCSLPQCISPKVDGQWTNWSPWFHCSATCGSGVTIRVRTCSNPPPTNGGQPCEHSDTFRQQQPCHVQPCPVTSGVYAITSTKASQSTNTVRMTHSSLSHVSTPALPSTTTQSSLSHVSTSSTAAHSSIPHVPTPSTTTHSSISHVSTPALPATTTHSSLSHVSTSALPATTTHSSLSHVSTSALPATTTHSSLSHITMMTPTTNPSACRDSAFCHDHLRIPLDCNDIYIASAYCPKLCGICGASVTSVLCVDKAGSKCQDVLYQKYACADETLAMLCAKTCGICN